MTKLVPLNDIHIKLGAKMTPFGGFNMPLQYTSAKEEILAVRSEVGVFDVSHMGEFFVEGKGPLISLITSLQMILNPLRLEKQFIHLL